MTDFNEIAEGQLRDGEKPSMDMPTAADSQNAHAKQAGLHTLSAPIASNGTATGHQTHAVKAKCVEPVATVPAMPGGEANERVPQGHMEAALPKLPRKGRQKAQCARAEKAMTLPLSDDNFTGKAVSAAPTGAKRSTPAGETVTQIMDLSRTRNTWQQARNRLHLHALALCRSFCAGDKAEAVKLFKATASGDDIRLLGLVGPMIEDIERWTERLKPVEKRLADLISGTPIADYIKTTKGLGALSMATLIGHTGPFSQYATVSKLWRRLGLCVSEDGSSRGALIVPGVADIRPRRAAAYVIGCGMIKAGNADFRACYDKHKARAMDEKGWAKARAHNHGMRVATKYLIKKMWQEWKAKDLNDQRP